jgi:hypothetical protein
MPVIVRNFPFFDKLEIDSGVMVYPKSMVNPPRSPVLGLRTLCRAKAHLTIDCRRQSATLRTTSRI